jgi:hypothetical protein
MKRIEAASRGLLRFSVHIVPRASRNQIAGWTSEGLPQHFPSRNLISAFAAVLMRG